MEVPLDPNTAKSEGMEPPGGYFSSHRIDRNEGNAKTRHHSLLDRLGMVQLHRHTELDARSLQRAFRDAASGRSFFPHK